MLFTIKRWLNWLPLFAIIIAGAVLRLYHIGTLPPGLYRDEAYYGLDALGILRGHLAVYFAANNGREGLFMYLLAGGIAVLGRTPEALRIVSALVGSATLIAIYAVGRNLFSHRTGVLSAAILAITFWHLTLSRVAYRATTLPLLLCITIACGAALVHAIHKADVNDQRARTRWVALSIGTGISFGLTFYTYTSASFILVLILAFILIYLLLHVLRFSGYGVPHVRAAKIALFVFALASLITLAPFLFWLVRHPEMLLARAEQVSILNPIINKGDVVGTLWQNIVKSAGMFAYEGDRIWRHNLPLRPVFDGGIATAFMIGVVVCLWRIFSARGGIRPASLFIMLWLVIFLIPTILAEDTPHYLRAIGALPAACVVAALGLEAVLAWLSRRGFLGLYFTPLRRVISPAAVVAALLLIGTGYGTAVDYFNVYVRKDMTAYWLEDNNVQLANTVNAYTSEHPAEALWLQDTLANDNPALRFLSPLVEEDRISIVGESKPAPAGMNILLLVDPNHDWTALRNELPPASQISVTEGPLAQNDLEPSPRRSYIAVNATPLTEPAASAARFGDDIHLSTVHVASTEAGYTSRIIQSFPLTATPQSQDRYAGQVYTVTLLWNTTKPITEDYAVFIHWWRNGIILTQNDSSPVQGYLPMPTWQPGDVIMDTHILTVSGGLQTGDEVDVGIYRRSDNLRLQAYSNAGAAATNESGTVRFLVASAH